MEFEVVISVGPFAGEVFARTHTAEAAERFATICTRRYGSAAVRSLSARPTGQPSAVGTQEQLAS